jgi:hypothetical protein
MERRRSSNASPPDPWGQVLTFLWIAPAKIQKDFDNESVFPIFLRKKQKQPLITSFFDYLCMIKLINMEKSKNEIRGF